MAITLRSRIRAKAAVQLKFQKGATQDEAVEKLANGAIELLLTDKDSGQSAVGSGQGEEGGRKETAPRSIELGRMAVAVIVHPDNPLESLPLDEARAVFTGEVKKWPAVRGAAAAMHVVGLRQSSPTTQLLKEKLGARKALSVTAQPDNEKVILAVARDPAAIGFVDMSQLSSKEKSVKLVPVLLPGQSLPKPVPAKQTTEAKGTKGKAGNSTKPAEKEQVQDRPEVPNPLERTLTLYVSPKASQVAKDFADFLTPEHCKEVIAQYHLLPPLHVEDAKQLATATKPRRDPQVERASADKPIPLLLDDPDAPQDQPQAKAKRPAAKPNSEGPEKSESAGLASDTKPAASDPPGKPTQKQPGSPSASSNELVWIICGVAGAAVLAVALGWLGASKRRKPRRYGPK